MEDKGPQAILDGIMTLYGEGMTLYATFVHKIFLYLYKIDCFAAFIFRSDSRDSLTKGAKIPDVRG